MAFAATKSVNQNQLFTSNVCGINARDANAAAIAYKFISGFRVSSVQQKGLNNSYVTRSCSQMQCSASLQQARNCRCHSVTIAFAVRSTQLLNMVATEVCTAVLYHMRHHNWTWHMLQLKVSFEINFSQAMYAVSMPKMQMQLL